MEHTTAVSPGATIPRRIDGKYSAVLIGKRIEIIKTETGEVLPHEEPLILFRAKDTLLRRMIAFYRDLCLTHGSPRRHLDGIDAEGRKVEQFAAAYPERMKIPD